MKNEILILEGARTPFCAWAGGARGDGQKGGALKPLDPFDLGAAALTGALGRCGLKPQALDTLIFGNMYAVGPNACYANKYVAYRAGVPASATGHAVVMACGTGLRAVITAAQSVESGEAAVAAAVGADNCSLVPRNVFAHSFLDLSCGLPIAQTAQNLAQPYGIGRAAQDRWARLSHQRAAAARARGLFKEEIVAAAGVDQDDAILEDPAPEHFSQSKLLFETGDATHANTHAIVDGGAAVLLASPAGAARASQQPLGRLLGWSIVGVPPERMAYSSVAAIQALLASLKLTVADIGLFEINETFAAQLLVGLKELGLAEDAVNVNGGGLALGHPFGATGPRLVHTLLKELRRRALKRGVASICVGGGTGVAVAVETL